MALSLNQVKAKKTPKAKQSKEKQKPAPDTAPSTTMEAAPEPETQSPAHARAPLRPWSQHDLGKKDVRSKRRQRADHHMNEEWMNLHEAPLFWIDLSGESKLAELQEKLLALERRASAVFLKPRELFLRARKTLRTLIA